ncbi:hypothetical protein N7475_000788 [Penicillium sp. IBT 31633x]|nr:hypothetical protein N7475_000788 [Penicillium sp. IBT 31633x]
MSWWVSHSQCPITSHPGQGAAKRTALQAGLDDEADSDDDLPKLPDSRARSMSSDSSSASIGSQSLPMKYSEQELIAKSKKAKERAQFEKAKSLLLRISDKTTYEPLLEELDTSWIHRPKPI